MKRSKSLIILVVLFLTIGFAAVSTTLILNGTINVGTNESDFDVYFSNAVIDGIEDLSLISQDKKTINFETKDLIKVGDKSILEYEVTNASTQYDANVSVTCTPNETDLYKVVNTIDKEIIEARSIGDGTVTVELKKNVLENQQINFACTITASALEREEASFEPVGWNCEYPEGTEWNFSYSGAEKDFLVPCDGNYKIALWGAQGGGSGGFGGYTSGEISLEKGKIIYIYVGNTGSVGSTSGAGGGYNGGGNGVIYISSSQTKYGGGGATDVRLENGAWNNFESLKSRIMVAAGGGGVSAGNGYTELPNMCAGGLNGYSGGAYSAGGGATQTSGGSNYTSSSFGTSERGTFGRGGRGSSHAAGGGGGYYGGGGGARDKTDGNGGGGSSFISGHYGSNALAIGSTSSNLIHTGQPNHYSKMIFTNTIIVDGAGYQWTNTKGEKTGMPSHDGTSIIDGNTGAGYAKITIIR